MHTTSLSIMATLVYPSTDILTHVAKENKIVIPANKETRIISKLEIIREFFSCLKKPIVPSDIDTIKSLYDVNIIEKNYCSVYELIVFENNGHHYLELIMYNNSRISIHLKYKGIQYTQYQMNDYIFQNLKLKDYTNNSIVCENKTYSCDKKEYVHTDFILRNCSATTKSSFLITESCDIKLENLEKKCTMKIAINKTDGTDYLFKYMPNKYHIYDITFLKAQININQLEILTDYLKNIEDTQLFKPSLRFDTMLPSIKKIDLSWEGPYGEIFERKQIYQAKNIHMDAVRHIKEDVFNIYVNNMNLGTDELKSFFEEKNDLNNVYYEGKNIVIIKKEYRNKKLYIKEKYVIPRNDIRLKDIHKLNIDFNEYRIIETSHEVYNEDGTKSRMYLVKTWDSKDIFIDFHYEGAHLLYTKYAKKENGTVAYSTNLKFIVDGNFVYWTIGSCNDNCIPKDEFQCDFDCEKRQHLYQNLDVDDHRSILMEHFTFGGAGEEFLSDFKTYIKSENSRYRNLMYHVKSPSTEIIDIGNSIQYMFRYSFEYNLIITKYGNTINKARQTVSSVKKGKKGKQKHVSSTKVNYSELGQEMKSVTVDGDGKLRVKTSNNKQMSGETIGYKGARTKDNHPCIVKLLIPVDAKVAFANSDKYRASKVKVLDIREIYADQVDLYTKIFDKLDKKCKTCLLNNAEYVLDKYSASSPQVLCEKCSATKHRIKVTRLLGPSLNSCYSCIYTQNFMYVKDEYITIPDFNGNLEEVCVPGIHYQGRSRDVFKWISAYKSRQNPNPLPEPGIDYPEQIEVEEPVEINLELKEDGITTTAKNNINLLAKHNSA